MTVNVIVCDIASANVTFSIQLLSLYPPPAENSMCTSPGGARSSTKIFSMSFYWAVL